MFGKACHSSGQFHKHRRDTDQVVLTKKVKLKMKMKIEAVKQDTKVFLPIGNLHWARTALATLIMSKSGISLSEISQACFSETKEMPLCMRMSVGAHSRAGNVRSAQSMAEVPNKVWDE